MAYAAQAESKRDGVKLSWDDAYIKATDDYIAAKTAVVRKEIDAQREEEIVKARRERAIERGQDEHFEQVHERKEKERIAIVLQQLWRTRVARAHFQEAISGIYTKEYDPISRQHYYFNSITGASSWEVPAILQHSHVVAEEPDRFYLVLDEHGFHRYFNPPRREIKFSKPEGTLTCTRCQEAIASDELREFELPPFAVRRYYVVREGSLGELQPIDLCQECATEHSVVHGEGYGAAAAVESDGGSPNAAHLVEQHERIAQVFGRSTAGVTRQARRSRRRTRGRGRGGRMRGTGRRSESLRRQVLRRAMG